MRNFTVKSRSTTEISFRNGNERKAWAFLLADICFSMSLFSKSRPERAQTTGSSGVTPDTGGRGPSEESKRKTQMLAGLKQREMENNNNCRRRRERKKERKVRRLTCTEHIGHSSIYPQKTSPPSSAQFDLSTENFFFLLGAGEGGGGMEAESPCLT